MSFLHDAEKLELAAVPERVTYLESLGLRGPVLDVGCGNGYAVAEWSSRGFRAVGVDSSFYRLSRWLKERPATSLVLADAAALPFRAGEFLATYSSGLIEHIGVKEQGGETYSVSELSSKHQMRKQAVNEMCRVTSAFGSIILDFPNGMFPIDFWHGTTLGAFRLHRIPDTLNPSMWDIQRYVPSMRVRLLALRNRLKFKQIGQRWWGRLLQVPARLFIRLLDLLPRRFRSMLGVLYPFVVIRIETPRLPR